MFLRAEYGHVHKTLRTVPEAWEEFSVLAILVAGMEEGIIPF